MPRRRGTGKDAEARLEVREWASACPEWSRPQTAMSILPHTPANPLRPKSHAPDYPPRATRPRIQGPPTAMLYAPSPIFPRNSGCPILEQITDWDSQRLLGEILQDTPGYPLVVPVPRSTHWIHLLPQPISLAHIDPRKKLTLKWPFLYAPTTPPGRLL